ncbi:hypothetical protein AAHB49_22865 [Bacillus cereus]
MKKSMVKLLMGFVLLFSLILPQTSFASPPIDPDRDTTPLTPEQEQLLVEKYEMDSMITEVEPFVTYSENEGIKLSSNIPSALYEKYKLSSLEEHFSQLNREVSMGMIAIDSDLNITSLKMNTAGISKVQKYWWGFTRWMDNIDTKNAVIKLKGVGNISSTSVFLRALGLPIVGFVTSVVGGYYKLVANRLEANNRGRGTVLSVTWAMAFNVSLNKEADYYDFRYYRNNNVSLMYWLFY